MVQGRHHAVELTSRTTWGGLPALASPNHVLILFTQVPTRPAISPQTAIWHFGWHVPDARVSLETYRSRAGVKLLPLYTGDQDRTDCISSDTWPGTGGVLGRTTAQIAEAKAAGVEPTRTGGFAYMQGPDNAIVEYAGNHPAERFNHVHMFQEDPLCAELWYQQRLGASLIRSRADRAPLTEATCQVQRGPDRSFPALGPRRVLLLYMAIWESLRETREIGAYHLTGDALNAAPGRASGVPRSNAHCDGSSAGPRFACLRQLSRAACSQLA
jgi:hypothetical protein